MRDEDKQFDVRTDLAVEAKDMIVEKEEDEEKMMCKA